MACADKRGYGHDKPIIIADESANNFKLLMQEAPNSYEKDEQQERGNYDSANYME